MIHNKEYIKEAKAIIQRLDELEDNRERYIPSMLKKEVQICTTALTMFTKGILIGLGEYEEKTISIEDQVRNARKALGIETEDTPIEDLEEKVQTCECTKCELKRKCSEDFKGKYWVTGPCGYGYYYKNNILTAAPINKDNTLDYNNEMKVVDFYEPLSKNQMQQILKDLEMQQLK
jgi:hypothetical protein